MKRREFVQKSFIGLGTLPFLGNNQDSKQRLRHVLSLSFDDGFKKSVYKIAEIHENYGLKACLNIIASGHLKSFNSDPKWVPQHLLGDFDDWNALQSRGHVIMPHSWEHLDLVKVPLSKAKENIDKCLSYFEENLNGYSNKGGVYNFAYNSSNSELEDYALSKITAVRTGGWLVLDGMVNRIPIEESSGVLGCWGKGPGNCDVFIEEEVNKFLGSEGGWLILNLHGLDEEGWGPISSVYLDRLLARLTKLDNLAILPIAEVLKKVKTG